MSKKRKRGRPRKKDNMLRRYWREAQNRHRGKINGLKDVTSIHNKIG